MRLVKIDDFYVNPGQVASMRQVREEVPNPSPLGPDTLEVDVTHLYMSDGSMFRFIGTVEQLLGVINDA